MRSAQVVHGPVGQRVPACTHCRAPIVGEDERHEHIGFEFHRRCAIALHITCGVETNPAKFGGHRVSK